MNRLEFFCFADFFLRIFLKPEKSVVFYKSASIEGTVNSVVEEKTQVFC
jgi:hypothetical protein